LLKDGAVPGWEDPEADANVSGLDVTACVFWGGGLPVAVPVSAAIMDCTSVSNCELTLLAFGVEVGASAGDGSEVPPLCPGAFDDVPGPVPHAPLNAIRARDMPSDSAPDVPLAALPAEPDAGVVVPLVGYPPGLCPGLVLGG
jgi:hypothetical protein